MPFFKILARLTNNPSSGICSLRGRSLFSLFSDLPSFCPTLLLNLLDLLMILGRPVILVEPPHVTPEAVLVPEGLAAAAALDEARLCPVHVPDVATEGVPGELLEAERAGLLLLACC